MKTKYKRVIGWVLILICVIAAVGMMKGYNIPILSISFVFLVLLVLGIVLAFNIKITLPKNK